MQPAAYSKTEAVKMSKAKEDGGDYNQDTWLSLLGLLHPSEFLVTVDHSQIWRKHVAWSKPEGQDLRNYTTQRFSSNMVFMSLILAAEINVLFNSSTIVTDIRVQMMNGNYWSLEHCIGFLVLLSACVTVIALVSTFTAWGMVSSIGDNNAHCLLRSSIGQLVTSLPSNYVVASLYLFLSWLVLFIIKLTTGPAQAVLLLVVMSLFLHAVVSLSAFGRLIIHTGAMGNRPVLDPSLEKALLPSGLHASLLIMATDRKRRQTSVMSMYRSPKRKINSDSVSLQLNGDSIRSRDVVGDVARIDSLYSNAKTRTNHTSRGNRRQDSQRSIPPWDDDTSTTNRNPSQIIAKNHIGNSTCSSPVDGAPRLCLTAEEIIAIESTLRSMTPDSRAPPSEGSISSFNRHENETLLPDYGLTNSESNSLYGSFSEIDFSDCAESLVTYPRPSILNKTVNGSDLKKVVEDALSTCSQSNQTNQKSQGETPLRRHGHSTVDRVKRRSVFGKKGSNRRSLLGGFREASARISIQAEWNEEEDVRSMYDIAPPAEVVFEDDKDAENSDDDDIAAHDLIMPHPSILNQTRRLQSLRRLVRGNSIDEPTSRSVDQRKPLGPQHVDNLAPHDAESGTADDDEGLVGESILLLQSPITE